MTIKKTTTKVYQVQAIMRNFCKFDEQFRKARLKYHRDKTMECFKCGYQFEEGNVINIFQMKGDTNRLCCNGCALEALKEGVA